jgi:hypothetical protein
MWQTGACYTEHESGTTKGIQFSFESFSIMICQRDDLRKFFAQSNFSGVTSMRVIKLNQFAGM